MIAQDIIVLGASAGGVEALSRLVGGLPRGLPAALFIVCHFPAESASALPQILSRHGPLPAEHVKDGTAIRPGRIYVAPPDYHLLLAPGVVHLDHGPRENRHRPAIDPMFRTAARTYGQRVVGVILSGLLHDGVAGLLAVRNAGGVAVIQDPAEAQLASLPLSALQIAGADHVLAAADIAHLVTRLAQTPVPQTESKTMDPEREMATRVAEDMVAQQRDARPGQVTVYSCPECGGPLWQVDEEGPLRFRCHVGHAYYGETLLAEQSQALEAALWTAVRTFREKAVLARQMASRHRRQNEPQAAGRFDDEAQVAERYGAAVKELLTTVVPAADKLPPE